MPLAGLIVLFLVFLALAPKFFRPILLWDFIIAIIGTIGIWGYAAATGRTRMSGLSGGSFEEGGAVILLMMLSVPAVMIFGILCGIAYRIVFALLKNAKRRPAN